MATSQGAARLSALAESPRRSPRRAWSMAALHERLVGERERGETVSGARRGRDEGAASTCAAGSVPGRGTRPHRRVGGGGGGRLRLLHGGGDDELATRNRGAPSARTGREGRRPSTRRRREDRSRINGARRTSTWRRVDAREPAQGRRAMCGTSGRTLEEDATADGGRTARGQRRALKSHGAAKTTWPRRVIAFFHSRAWDWPRPRLFEAASLGGTPVGEAVPCTRR